MIHHAGKYLCSKQLLHSVRNKPILSCPEVRCRFEKSKTADCHRGNNSDSADLLSAVTGLQRVGSLSRPLDEQHKNINCPQRTPVRAACKWMRCEPWKNKNKTKSDSCASLSWDLKHFLKGFIIVFFSRLGLLGFVLLSLKKLQICRNQVWKKSSKNAVDSIINILLIHTNIYI